MGASWRRGSAAALLLVLAAALAAVPPAQAGSEAAPEVSDPAGDQEVAAGPLVVPGVNDEAFDDVDVVAAWAEEPPRDCVGETAATCPAVQLVVQTAAGWTTGTMTLGFTVKRGPTSLPGSTATAAGTPFTLNITGMTVTGPANVTAVGAADGLRITLPLSRIGATGGDLLSDLTLSTTRTDAGLLQASDQDDQTGTDGAGPGTAYTFARPPLTSRLLLDVVSIAGQTGAAAVTDDDGPVPVVLRITNLGLDADAWQLSFESTPPLGDAPVFAQAFTPIAPGAADETTVDLSLDGMAEGRIALTFTATSERGASTTARAALTLDLPAAAPPPDREVRPEGLTFLTSAAEAIGLDGPFDSYAELVLLAALVLVVILLVFLLAALGRTTMDGEPAHEAPWLTPSPAAAGAGLAAGPSGVMETVHADGAPPALFPPEASAADAAVDALPDVDAAALAAALAVPDAEAAAEAPAVRPAPVKAGDAGLLPTASGAASPRIRIEEVRHMPAEPEAGEPVTTEVLLRNDGSTATLRVALSLDGKPAAERTVQVPAHATKAVELPWTAGPGDNRVKISAYPA